MFVIEWRLNQNEQNDKTNWNVCVFCTPNFFSSRIFWVWIFQKHTKVRLCVEKTSSQSPSARPCINIALEFMPLPMMMVPWVQAFVDMTWHNFQWGQREKQKLETTNKVYEWGSLNSNNDKENVDWWHLVLANDNNICPNKVKIYVRVLWYIKTSFQWLHKSVYTYHPVGCRGFDRPAYGFSTGFSGRQGQGLMRCSYGQSLEWMFSWWNGCLPPPKKYV